MQHLSSITMDYICTADVMHESYKYLICSPPCSVLTTSHFAVSDC
jgi:hypothetical protein